MHAQTAHAGSKQRWQASATDRQQQHQQGCLLHY
jgi:hypothetical protein